MTTSATHGAPDLATLAHDAGLDLVPTDTPQRQDHTRLTTPRRAHSWSGDRPPSRILVATPECTRCRTKLPASAFRVRGTANGQRRAQEMWCRDCDAEAHRQTRAVRDDVDRLWPLVRKQGHSRRMLFRVLRAVRAGNAEAARQLLVMLGVGL